MRIKDTMEGFQTIDSLNNTCTTYAQIDNKTYWLCPSDYTASAKVRDLISTGNKFQGACYKTEQGFYTCYTRPSQKTFDSNLGIWIVDDPSNDYMPFTIESDIQNVCNDYSVTFATFSTMYLSTKAIGTVIDSAISEVKYATSQLSNVSTTYCPATKRLDTATKNACNTLTEGIGIFVGIPNLPDGLNYMSNTVVTALSNMDGLYSDFSTAYKGFGYSTCKGLA